MTYQSEQFRTDEGNDDEATPHDETHDEIPSVVEVDPSTNDAHLAGLLTIGDTTVQVTKISGNPTPPEYNIGNSIQGKISRPLSLGSIVLENGFTSSGIQTITAKYGGDDLTFDCQTMNSLYQVKILDQDVLKKTLLYLKKGYLGFDEVIPDGFYDGGRSMRYNYETSTEHLYPTSKREILCVDSRADRKLKQYLEKVDLIEHIQDKKSQVMALATYVYHFMGGTYDDFEAFNTQVEIDVAQCRERSNSSLVPIGELNHGCCRHRAILFKYLADRIGMKSRLVRGDMFNPHGEKLGGHAWNIVEIEGRYFVVELMEKEVRLFPYDPELDDTYKRKGSDGRYGGIGGNSIDLNEGRRLAS